MQLGTLRPLLLLGGVAGALVRWGVGHSLNEQASNFPWGTLAVNLVGCGLLGYFVTTKPSQRHLAVTIGFCGGLTTFSTLMVELVRKSQSQQLADGLSYLLLSLGGGGIAFLLGRMIGLDPSPRTESA